MPIKASNNERMRRIAAHVSGEVCVRIDTTLTPNWLHVVLYYGDESVRTQTVNGIDAAVDACIDEAEILLGIGKPVAEEVEA